jgi:hypothetical protein
VAGLEIFEGRSAAKSLRLSAPPRRNSLRRTAVLKSVIESVRTWPLSTAWRNRSR